LAATLSSNYGIYGPAFELMANVARPASGEYLDNEKYELKHWDIDRADSLRFLIERVNRARQDNTALHNNESLRFHPIENDQLICYSKHARKTPNVVLVVVNLDPHNVQAGWVHLDLQALGLSEHEPFVVHDLLSGARFTWRGPGNFVQLNPQEMPAHLFVIEGTRHLETDYEHYE
jgi:starch synthase (maltosyl-transferring)